MMHLNDFDFEDSSGQKIRYFRRPVSFVLELVRRLYDEAVLGKSGRDYHLFHFAKRKADVLREIDAMQALAADRGFDFQIIVLPLLGRSFRDYDYRVIHDELAGAFSKRGIAYVDLLSAFGDQNTAPLFFAHDMWHPNARGHAFIASRLVEPVLGAKFEAARRAAPSRRWNRVAPDLLSLDFSALDGITVTEARRRTRSGGAVEERVTLDGGKGMVAVEHLPDALIDPALARSLGRKETLMAKFRETGARLRFPALIERLVDLSGARSVGGYARYAIPRAGLSCVFAYAGYGLGDPGRFTVRGYDTLVSLNYCGRTSREDVIARFLRGLSARPAEGPA
jgi:hypothetical protein